MNNIQVAIKGLKDCYKYSCDKPGFVYMPKQVMYEIMCTLIDLDELTGLCAGWAKCC